MRINAKTLEAAVTAELNANGWEPYPGALIILTAEETKKLGSIYLNAALAVCPNWNDMTNEQKTQCWQEVDTEVESRGYYVIGEKRDTPLKHGPGGSEPPEVDEDEFCYTEGEYDAICDALQTCQKQKNDWQRQSVKLSDKLFRISQIIRET